MTRFLIALRFLTIFPLGKVERVSAEEIARSMGYFPLVGLGLGIILVLGNYILSPLFPRSVVDVILIALLVVSTGALHLDGFADTLDGLAGGRTKEEILAIMRDSRTGAVGVIGVIILLMLKFFSLSSIPLAQKIPVLLLMPLIARWSMIIMAFFSSYSREGSGVGKCFPDFVGIEQLQGAAIFTLMASLIFLGWRGLIILILVTFLTFLFTLYFNRKLKGVTGDIFGATNEINEVVLLLLVLVL